MAPEPSEILFFETPAELRDWFAARPDDCKEVWVGFHKKGSGRPTITWPEAVDEALCVGWIDGVRYRIDESSYRIRFTPRKPRSTWSLVNVGRVEDLMRQGRMTPEGLNAFALRVDGKTGTYSYEQKGAAALDEAAERQFRERPDAWSYFESRPAWYRRTATHWVVSAKREETRRKRLATLIAESAEGRHIPSLRRPAE